MTKYSTIQPLKAHDLGQPFDDLGRIPFGTFIGRILSACVDAQEAASTAAWDYVKQVLSHEAPVVFTFMDGSSVRRIGVPLITIVPLPYIKLERVKIDFDANVKVNNEYSNQFVVQVNNSSTHEGEVLQTAKSEANMHIDIDAGTVDMPAGLATLLNWMNGGVVVEDVLPEQPAVSGSRSIGDIIDDVNGHNESENDGDNPGSGSGHGPTIDDLTNGLDPLWPDGCSSGSGSGQGLTVDEVSNVIGSIEPDPNYGVSSGDDSGSMVDHIADTIYNSRKMYGLETMAPSYQSDKGLLALHVNWTKPSQVRNPQGNYHIADFEILSTILSACLWRQYNGPIKMYTDNIGYDFYDSWGLLGLWDGGVDVDVLEGIPNDIPADIFWAGGKLYAIKEQKVPFVMMDTDLLVWNSIHDIVAGKKLMAYHSESLEQLKSCYIDYRFLKKREGYKPDPNWDWNQDPYNTALTYFNDSKFLKYYTDKSIDFMRGNTERPMEMVSQMVFAEQRIFGMCAKRKKIAVGTFLTSPYDNNPSFTHIWGGKDEARNNPQSEIKLCEALSKAITNRYGVNCISPQVSNLLLKYKS